jgi:hypothetical protein
MSTAPIIDVNLPPTWEGQLSALLGRFRNFATRADAESVLLRMARLAELYVADHPAKDGSHTNAGELLRANLRAHLAGDAYAYTRLLHIAKLADMYEAARKGA